MKERYEIRRKIGQGGLGAVYQAYDTQLQRDVAIKRMFAPVDADGNVDRESTAEKLMREATALSRLNHQNIVSIFDVGVDADGGYVVMELLKGETLAEAIPRGTLTLEDFHQVVIQTLEALIAAESQNMLHRDLKPSNIMLIWLPSGRFLLKVLDFGLAKVSAQPALQTIDQTNSVLGSVFYMAPEQFERRELDFCTDLYSMGCIYYFCLAGRDPFTGRSVADVMNAHLAHRVVPLHEIRPDLPREVCDWVMWLLARQMGQRPQTAQIALDNFPLVEDPGGEVRIDPQPHFAIPVATPAGSPRFPAPAGEAATGSSRVPVFPATGALPGPETGSTRIPISRASGPVPARAATARTRVPSVRPGAVPPTLPPSKLPTSRVQFQRRRSAPFPKPLLTGLGAGVALIAVIILALALANRSPGPASAVVDSGVAALFEVPPNRLAAGEEVQFSFTLLSPAEKFLRFALLQRDHYDASFYHGYTFDVDQTRPFSLRLQTFSNAPASQARELLPAGGRLLQARVEGRNIRARELRKVDLRIRLSAGRSLAFAVSLSDSMGAKCVYFAVDANTPLTSIDEYGFRTDPGALARISDRKFVIAKLPGSVSVPETPPPAAAFTMDSGKLPGNGLRILSQAPQPPDPTTRRFPQ